MFKLTFIINVSFNNQSCLRLDNRRRVPPRGAPVVTSGQAFFLARARARPISNFLSTAALLVTRPH
jgi:hypothetical protein